MLEDAIRRAQTGDTTALDDLFRTAWADVYGYIRTRVADDDAATDVFVDFFALYTTSRIATGRSPLQECDPARSPLAHMKRWAHFALLRYYRRERQTRHVRLLSEYTQRYGRLDDGFSDDEIASAVAYSTAERDAESPSPAEPIIDAIWDRVGFMFRGPIAVGWSTVDEMCRDIERLLRWAFENRSLPHYRLTFGLCCVLDLDPAALTAPGPQGTPGLIDRPLAELVDVLERDLAARFELPREVVSRALAQLRREMDLTVGDVIRDRRVVRNREHLLGRRVGATALRDYLRPVPPVRAHPQVRAHPHARRPRGGPSDDISHWWESAAKTAAGIGEDEIRDVIRRSGVEVS